MHGSAQDFWPFVAIVGFFLAIQFKWGWRVLGFLAITAFKVVRWACIVGMVTALLTAPPTYRMLGWTPLSLIFGDKIYDRALQRGEFAPKNAKTNPSRRPALESERSTSRVAR